MSNELLFNNLLNFKDNLGDLIQSYSALAEYQNNPAQHQAAYFSVDVASTQDNKDLKKWIHLLATQGNKKNLTALVAQFKKDNKRDGSLQDLLQVMITPSDKQPTESSVYAEGKFNLMSHQLMVLARVYEYIDSLKIEELKKDSQAQKKIGMILNDVMTISLTTGAGKTLIQGLLLKACASAGLDVGMFFPESSLVTQAFADWKKLGIQSRDQHTAFIKHKGKDVCFSVKTHADLIPDMPIDDQAPIADIIIVDEAHLLSDKNELTYKKLIQRLKQSWCFLVSASPSINMIKAISLSKKTRKNMGELTNRSKADLGMTSSINITDLRPKSLYELLVEQNAQPSTGTWLDGLMRSYLKPPTAVLDSALLQIDTSPIQNAQETDLRALLRKNFSSPIFEGKILFHASNYEDIVNTMYRYELGPNGKDGWINKGQYYSRSAPQSVSDVNDYKKYLKLRSAQYERLWLARLQQIKESSSRYDTSLHLIDHTRELISYWAKADKNSIELNAHIHGQVDFYLAFCVAAAKNDLNGTAVDVIKKYGPAGYLNENRQSSDQVQQLLEMLQKSFQEHPERLIEIQDFLKNEGSLPTYVKDKFKIGKNVEHFVQLLNNDPHADLLVENYQLEDFRGKDAKVNFIAWKNSEFFTECTELSNDLRNLGFFKKINKNEHQYNANGILEPALPEDLVFSGVDLKIESPFKVKKPVQNKSVLEKAVDLIATAIDYGPATVTFRPEKVYSAEEISFQGMKNLHLTGLGFAVVSDSLMEAHDDRNLHVNVSLSSEVLDKTNDPSNEFQSPGRLRALDPYKKDYAIGVLKNDIQGFTLKELFSYDQFDFYQTALQKRLGRIKEEMLDQYVQEIKNICSDRALTLLEKEKEFLKVNNRLVENFMLNLSFDKEKALKELDDMIYKARYTLEREIESVEQSKTNFSLMETVKQFGLKTLMRLQLISSKQKSQKKDHGSRRIPEKDSLTIEQQRLGIAQASINLPLDNFATFLSFMAVPALSTFKTPPKVTKNSTTYDITSPLVIGSLRALIKKPSVAQEVFDKSYSKIKDIILAIKPKQKESLDDLVFQIEAELRLRDMSDTLIKAVTDTIREQSLAIPTSLELLEEFKTTLHKKITEQIQHEKYQGSLDEMLEICINKPCNQFYIDINSNRLMGKFQDSLIDFLDNVNSMQQNFAQAFDLKHLEHETNITQALNALKKHLNQPHSPEKIRAQETLKTLLMSSPYFSRYQLAERESIIDMIFNDVNFALDEFEIKDLKTLQLLADKNKIITQDLLSKIRSLTTENYKTTFFTGDEIQSIKTILKDNKSLNDLVSEPISNILKKLKSRGINTNRTLTSAMMTFIQSPERVYLKDLLRTLISQGHITDDILNQFSASAELMVMRGLGDIFWKDPYSIDSLINIEVNIKKEKITIAELLKRINDQPDVATELKDRINRSLEHIEKGTFKTTHTQLSTLCSEASKALLEMANNIREIGDVRRQSKDGPRILNVVKADEILEVLSLGIKTAGLFSDQQSNEQMVLESAADCFKSFNKLIDNLSKEDNSVYSLIADPLSTVIGSVVSIINTAKRLKRTEDREKISLKSLGLTLTRAALYDLDKIQILIDKIPELKEKINSIKTSDLDSEQKVIIEKAQLLINKLGIFISIVKYVLPAFKNMNDQQKLRLSKIILKTIKEYIETGKVNWLHLTRAFPDITFNYSWNTLSSISLSGMKAVGYDMAVLGYHGTSTLARGFYQFSGMQSVAHHATALGHYTLSKLVPGFGQYTERFSVDNKPQEAQNSFSQEANGILLLAQDIGSKLLTYSGKKITAYFSDETTKEEIDYLMQQGKLFLTERFKDTPEAGFSMLSSAISCYPLGMKSIEDLAYQGNDDASVIMQLEGIVLDKITEALTSKEFKEYWTQIKDHFTVEQINQIARSGDWYNSIEALQAGNQEVLLKEGLSRSHIISQFLTGLLSMQSTLIHDLNITVDGFDPGSLINTIYVGMQYFSLPISPESKELVTRYKALKDLPADRSQKLLKGIIGDQRLDKVLETSLLGSLSGIVDTYITLEKQKESHSTCEAAKMLQTFQQTKGDQGLFSAYKEELKKDSDDLTVSLKN
ncbi:hypothetical protein EBQ91_03810, partial [bacterium]|nr:hypothetical protein [bacterium]